MPESCGSRKRFSVGSRGESSRRPARLGGLSSGTQQSSRVGRSVLAELCCSSFRRCRFRRTLTKPSRASGASAGPGTLAEWRSLEPLRLGLLPRLREKESSLRVTLLASFSAEAQSFEPPGRTE